MSLRNRVTSASLPRAVVILASAAALACTPKVHNVYVSGPVVANRRLPCTPAAAPSNGAPAEPQHAHCQERSIDVVGASGASLTRVSCEHGVPTLVQRGADWDTTRELPQDAWDALWRSVGTSPNAACDASGSWGLLRVHIYTPTFTKAFECKGDVGQPLRAALTAVENAPTVDAPPPDARSNVCAIDPSACPRVSERCEP